MSRYIESETIELNGLSATAFKSALSRTILDSTGIGRPSRCTVYVHGNGCYFNPLGDTPVESEYNYLYVGPGGSIDIDGYDNMAQALFANLDNTVTTLFVVYQN